MGRYIADFCSANPKLIIELDGIQHEDQQTYDEARTQYLESQGYSVLRFWNGDVLAHLGDVLNAIADEIRNRRVWRPFLNCPHSRCAREGTKIAPTPCPLS